MGELGGMFQHSQNLSEMAAEREQLAKVNISFHLFIRFFK